MPYLRSVGLAIIIISVLAGPVASQGSDDVCSSMLVPLINQAGLIPEASAPALGCREDDLGEWYMPTIGEVIDDVGSAELRAQSLELLNAVDRMSTEPAFSSSLRFLREDTTALVPGRGGEVDSIDVSDNGLASSPMWLNSLRENYNQSMQTYLTRTAGQEVELVEYLQWFMARRDTMLSVITQQMNPLSGPAFLTNWGYQQFPWPWQLADPVVITAYTGEEAADPTFDDAALTPNPAVDASDLSAVFSPPKLLVAPGGEALISVSPPPTNFGGFFALVVTVPPEVYIATDSPGCASSQACEDATLEIGLVTNSDGSTVVEMSGVLYYDDPPELILPLQIAEGAGLDASLTVTKAWIDNLPRYLIDQDGAAACAPGHEGDIVAPSERVTQLDHFPPSHLELAVDPDVQPGDRLRVCVEMVGFSGDPEIFSWNAGSIIEIVG